MSFKTDNFLSSEFKRRVECVPVPGMAEWFDGAAEFYCSGLTLSEVNFAEIMAQGRRQKLRQAANLPIQEMPIATALKIEYVALALVPKISYDAALKLSEVYPVEFNLLFLKIAELTGEGQQHG